MNNPPISNAPTVSPTELDYAYAAGIIDGEGNVSIRKKAQRDSRRVRDIHTEVIVSMTHRPVLEWLQARWGGGVFQTRYEGQYAHWQSVYRWTLYSARAGTFLHGVYPFIIVKKPQVELAMEFQAFMNEWGSNRYHLGSKGFRRLPDAILERREEYFTRMQVLNIMGRGYEEREALKKVIARREKTLATGLSTDDVLEEAEDDVGSSPVIRDV